MRRRNSAKVCWTTHASSTCQQEIGQTFDWLVVDFQRHWCNAHQSVAEHHLLAQSWGMSNLNKICIENLVVLQGKQGISLINDYHDECLASCVISSIAGKFAGLKSTTLSQDWKVEGYEPVPQSAAKLISSSSSNAAMNTDDCQWFYHAFKWSKVCLSEAQC